MSQVLPLSEPVRMNQVGVSLTRVLSPDEETRRRIAKSLQLQSLDSFEAEMTIAPNTEGWILSGRLKAHAVQSCGLTLEPLPVDINNRFSIQLLETAVEEGDEIDLSPDDEGADVIENGRIDLGQYALEQLVLALDPFPRKPGAEFVQPEEPTEISPFAVLKAMKSKAED